eukprot:TRINITY_DN22830_c0_g1_i1.p1 TRINITY_DN22830_c0_g1~~TRINITY_DN22830_c0_g1_i1.p1  ORF type:complete len:490 (-),score=138.50 TRINITY_DN22830_c0_g1_i1:91-1383(-)
MTEEEVKKNSDELVDILKSSTTKEGKAPQADLNLWDFIDIADDPTTRYQTFETIGEGFGGIVYLCKDAKTNEDVAIKKVILTEENEKSLATEIFMMKTSSHPNIVEFKKCYYCATRIWIVMEYMDGGSLGDIIDVHHLFRLTELQIRWVIWNVAKGLSFLHKKDRIHRDIKSDNILLTTDGQVKIGDFGFVAQLLGKDKKRRTRLGTPYWMAPEVIKGKKYDYTADVWSLGILVWECAEGDPPYYNLTKLKALLQITKYGCPPLNNVDAWSNEMNDFLKLCLKKKPEKRATMDMLLKHPWLQPAASDSNTNRLTPLVKAVKEKKLQKEMMGPTVAKEFMGNPINQILFMAYGPSGAPDRDDSMVTREESDIQIVELEKLTAREEEGRKENERNGSVPTKPDFVFKQEETKILKSECDDNKIQNLETSSES